MSARVLLIAILLLAATGARGAGAAYLGDCTSHEVVDYRATFHCGASAVVVSFLDPRVCRISLYPDGVIADDSSAAVVQHVAQGFLLAVAAGDDSVVLKSSAMTVVCREHPFRIHVRGAAGESLLDEPPDGGMSWTGAQRAFRFAIGEDHLYGLGERATDFDRRGQLLGTYNQAVYGYGPYTPTMNIHIPFVTSSRGWGLLFDNPWPGAFDLAYSQAGVLAGSAQGGPMRLYVIQGSGLEGTLERYAWLTGRAPLPPRWALGYLQSKFGYRNRTEVENLVGRFRTLGIPLDAVILDLYWYGQPGDMGRLAWDAASWPQPQQMMSNLLATGVHTVLIEEPYLVTSTANYSDAAAKGLLGTTPGGAPYAFDMWAGTAGLVDFTKPAARDWWWQLHRPLFAQGVSGWWLDLGEPETHPDDLMHAGGPARAVHDVYNLAWLQGLYQAQRAERPDQRVFLLTRSGYAGMQRTGAVSWSGDVQRTFADLAAQVPMLLGMSLSGIGWHNSDIGGFAFGTTTPELYVRWMQFGTFCPLTRAHSSGQDAEPWAFGPDAQAICRRYLQLRQRLIPYSYTLAREFAQSGLPQARPLVLEFPGDPRVGQVADEYMWGSALLVAPVTVSGATSRSVYLPAGRWTNYWTNEELAGPGNVTVAAPLERMPLFVRAGSILPMQNVMPSSAAFAMDTLTLDVVPADTASLGLYEDDGASYAYETGAHVTMALSFGAGGTSARIHIGTAVGSYAGQPRGRTWCVGVRHVTAAPQHAWLAGRALEQRADSVALLSAGNGWWYDPAGSRVVVKLWLAATQSADVVLDSVGIAGVLDPPAPPATSLALAASVNPVKDVTTLRFVLPPGEDVVPRVEVFDARGRRVADLGPAVTRSGRAGSVDFHTLGIPQGVYYVKLTAGQSEKTLRLTVVR